MLRKPHMTRLHITQIQYPTSYHVMTTQMVDTGGVLGTHRGTQEDHLTHFPLD